MQDIYRLEYCPACGSRWSVVKDGKRGTRIIAIYDRVQDRSIAWRCPDCGRQWDRGAEVEMDAAVVSDEELDAITVVAQSQLETEDGTVIFPADLVIRLITELRRARGRMRLPRGRERLDVG